MNQSPDYLDTHQLRGISLEDIWRDRIPQEALATGADPLHLALVFNIGHTNATAYANAARNLLSDPAGQALLPFARNDHDGARFVASMQKKGMPTAHHHWFIGRNGRQRRPVLLRVHATCQVDSETALRRADGAEAGASGHSPCARILTEDPPHPVGR